MAQRKQTDGKRDGSRGGTGRAGVLYLRVTTKLLEQLDKKARAMSREVGFHVSRSDAANAMIVAGLES